MANGKVYVFNSYNEVLSLSVNGANGGTIGGWSLGDGTTKYTPTGKSYDIVKHIDGPQQVAVFGYNLPNEVFLGWEDGGAASVNINMPGPHDNVSITNDIIIYISHNQAIVMDTNGFVLSTSTVTLK